MEERCPQKRARSANGGRGDSGLAAATLRTRGEIAWFVMEIDYMRYSGQGPNQQIHVLPLRETGVLERRNCNWILVAWHESLSIPGSDSLRP